MFIWFQSSSKVNNSVTILKYIENIDTTLNVVNAPVDPDNSTNKDADNSRNSSG